MSNLRELDAWLAEHLFGWKWHTYDDRGEGWFGPPEEIGKPCGWDSIREAQADEAFVPLAVGPGNYPHYTTTGDGMMLVFDAMEKRGYRLALEYDDRPIVWGEYVAEFKPNDDESWGTGATIPEAVARAAKAVLEAQEND